MSVCLVVCFVFFQAEDGIRDLVRSRGLGDVYKRQSPRRSAPASTARGRSAAPSDGRRRGQSRGPTHRPVSYTHLTLPTSDLV